MRSFRASLSLIWRSCWTNSQETLTCLWCQCKERCRSVRRRTVDIIPWAAFQGLTFLQFIFRIIICFEDEDATSMGVLYRSIKVQSDGYGSPACLEWTMWTDMTDIGPVRPDVSFIALHAASGLFADCENRILIFIIHYNDVIMGTMASQITSRTIVYSSVYSGADQRKHQSSASLTFVRGIHRWLMNSPHKWP